MDRTPVHARHRQVFLVTLIFQFAIAILISGQAYVLCAGQIPWLTLALYYLVLKSVWLVLAPIVLWLTDRLPLERVRWKRNLGLHFIAASAVSIIALGPNAAVDRYFRIYAPAVEASLLGEYMHLVWMYFHEGILVYFAIVGTDVAFDYYQRYRDREVQAARLKEQLAQAQLQALRAQLQPHFLFNTLNSIVGLVRNNENKAAITMTAQLSELLRHVLDQSDKQEVPLRDELETTQQYLDIQQTRFSDRLSIRMDIDPDTLQAKVPSLILQPLVENAFRHGVSSLTTASQIALTTERENGSLRIEVYNDGPALPSNWKLDECTGIGLANTSARLKQLYGGRHTFTLANKGDSGVAANIVIPFTLENENH